MINRVRAAQIKAALFTSVSLAVMASAPAKADSVVLEGNYIEIGVSDIGTIGYGGNTEPGILYDGTGTKTFNTANDYLTPGSPWEMFTVAGSSAAGTFSYTNNNAGEKDIAGSLTDYSGTAYAGTTYDHRAVWTGGVTSLFDITNDYGFNDNDQAISITTTLTADTDLTNVTFARGIDPDAVAAAGDSSSTNNYRGTDTISANDLVYAEALVSKYVIGLYTDSDIAHNSAVTGWSTDTASYISGTDVGDGDNTIGIGFTIGDMAAGSTTTLKYSYVFGTDISAAIDDNVAVTPNITGTAYIGDLLAGSVNPTFDGGTLETEASGSLSFDFTVTSNNGTIDTDGNDVAIIGSITGDGGLTKTGEGTLVLTGANTYSGGTTIAEGTLVGSTDSIQGAIVNNAALIIDQDTVGTLASDMSGTGSFTKDGAGNVTLTGTNSYTGGTTIAAGTLTGTTQSLQGNMVDNATLVFDQASDGTFAGDVSGTGSLTKQGDGTLTLTGTNSYTGGTTVAAGTLVGNTDSIQGPVLDNAALTFDQSYNGTYADTISGTGGLTKSGTGTVNLTGASDYTGATTVTAGRLAVNGSIVNSVVTVDDGGTIGGNGIIGGLIVHSNGRAAPGNSIGQLNVAGNVTFEKGSIYEAEIDAAGHSDLIVASGKANIEGGTVSVLAQNGNYKPQGTYLILTANQGVSGAFDAVTSNLAFLVPTLSYSTDGVFVTMTRNDVTFAQAGTTANQRTTGAAIDGLFKIGTPIYDALVSSSTSEIGSGLDAMSGEIHASALSAVADDAAGLRRTLLDRAASPIDPDHHIALWGDASGNWLKRDASASTAKVSTSGYRMMAGVDVSFGNHFRIGAAGGTSNITANVTQRASQADVDGTFGAIYANAAFGPVRLRAGATYAGLTFKTTRSIDYRTLQETLKANYDGSTKQVFGEAGLVLPLGAGSVEPFAGFTGMWLKNDSFTETGGTAALQADGRTHGGYGWTTVGMRATVGDQTSPIVGHAKVAWEHATSSVDVVSVQSFAAGGDAFSIYGAPLSRNAMNLDASLEWRATGALSFTVGYTGVIGSRNTDNGIRGSAVFRF